MTMPDHSTHALSNVESHLDQLAELLHTCVHHGASISFVMPFSLDQARDFWQKRVAPGVANGSRLLLAAFDEGRLVGTVQLDCDTPPNQPHRAEICKLMVHPDARRRGIARELMLAAEHHARQRSKTLLTLDTRTGDHAEPLYLALGYDVAGRIPDYAWNTDMSALHATTLMYKRLPANAV